MKRKGFTKIEISVDRGIYDRAEVVTRRLHVNGISNCGVFKIAKNKLAKFCSSKSSLIFDVYLYVQYQVDENQLTPTHFS